MSKQLILGAIAATGLMMGSAAYANHHEKDGKMTKSADSADANQHGQDHKKMKQGDATDANQHGQDHKMMKQGAATDANHHGQDHKMMKQGAATDANHHGQDHKMMKPAVAAGGKTVMINGREVTICTKTVQDSCINPREAGLKWGNRPLDYWPGKPASEK